MSVELVPENNHYIIPSIRFEQDCQGWNAVIYYDHIAVAYLSVDGGIRALPFETGSWYDGETQEEEVEYLKSKGVSLISESNEEGTKVVYYVETGQ